MPTFLQDLRYGARTIRRAPGFAFVAIATLALGIGANTAIFSVVNTLLLRPLPYPGSDRLVMVWQDMRARGGPANEWATPGNLADWKASGLFSGVTAMQGWQTTITGSGEPEAIAGEMVTHEYFDVLGVPPIRGRSFAPDDDVPNAARVVVLSHGLWQRRFGGDDSVIGRVVTLGGEAHTVVGVMPAGFRPAINASAEIWRPRRLDLAAPSRGAVILRAIARLSDGATMESTSAGLTQLAARLAALYPDSNTRVGFTIVPLHAQVVGDIRLGLLVLLGAVGFVLLIACANIANLLLARASSRTREMAVRLALGAGRRRLVRQLLTESVLLSAIGGSVGVLLGIWGLEVLVALAPRGAPRVEEIGLDATVLAFAFGLAIVTGLLFGTIPALQAARADVAPALKEGARGQSAGSGYVTRRALIVVEVAAAVVLMVGGGLLTRTLVKLQRFDLGFSPDRVLVGQVNPPRATYQTRADISAFYDRLLERVTALPGVEAAALTSVTPLGGDSDMDIVVEGRPLARPDAADTVWYRLVSPDYFRVMGISILTGRSFVPREPAPAVIVSDVSARRFWGDENPIGKRVRFGNDKSPWFTVVGVAREVRMRGARGGSRSEVYLPYWQLTEAGTTVVLKTSGPPEQLAGPLRAAVLEVDPGIAVAGVATMAGTVAESIDQPRFFAFVVGLFAALATALAAVGIYGLVAYAVARRTQEIGVRLALGARGRDVVALIVRDGLAPVLGGVVIGVAVAVAVSTSLDSLLFGVPPIDLPTFAATIAALVLVALLACLVPAHRASRVDPVVALRAE